MNCNNGQFISAFSMEQLCQPPADCLFKHSLWPGGSGCGVDTQGQEILSECKGLRQNGEVMMELHLIPHSKRVSVQNRMRFRGSAFSEHQLQRDRNRSKHMRVHQHSQKHRHLDSHIFTVIHTRHLNLSNACKHTDMPNRHS